MLFDKDLDGVTAYLKQFGSFSDTEEVFFEEDPGVFLLLRSLVSGVVFELSFGLCLLGLHICESSTLCSFLRDEFFAAVLANLPVSFAFCLHSELLKQHLRFFVSIVVQCCSTLFSLMSFWAE